MFLGEEIYNKRLEEFENFWRKEAEDIRERELTEDGAWWIRHNYESSELYLRMFLPRRSGLSILQRLENLKREVYNSVAIAESNYRARHKSLLERLIDAIGGFTGGKFKEHKE